MFAIVFGNELVEVLPRMFASVQMGRSWSAAAASVLGISLAVCLSVLIGCIYLSIVASVLVRVTPLESRWMFVYSLPVIGAVLGGFGNPLRMLLQDTPSEISLFLGMLCGAVGGIVGTALCGFHLLRQDES
jgi:hypothetical protein